jgi:hypothetical protein
MQLLARSGHSMRAAKQTTAVTYFTTHNAAMVIDYSLMNQDFFRTPGGGPCGFFRFARLDVSLARADR